MRSYLLFMIVSSERTRSAESASVGLADFAAIIHAFTALAAHYARARMPGSDPNKLPPPKGCTCALLAQLDTHQLCRVGAEVLDVQSARVLLVHGDLRGPDH